MRCPQVVRGSAMVLLVAIALLGSFESAMADDPKPYIVKDGMVDKGTYNGWRRFHSVCYVCHGQGAVGTSFAPSLVDSLKRLSYDDFLATVAQGREGNIGGVQRVMPSFANVPDVMEYIDDIYAYLKARSDGAIGPTRPERFPTN